MKKEWLLFFTSFAVIFLLMAGFGEIALRIRFGSRWLPKELNGGLPPHLVIPDERLRYTLKPGFVGREEVPGHPDVEIRVNPLGLRDYERPFSPSDEIILAIGDSMTFGDGVPFDQIWPTLLENKIRADAPQYFLMKAGVPGFSWRQYLWQYERLVKHLERHPLVIVGFTVDAGERLGIGYEAKGGAIVKRFYPNLTVLDGLVFEKQSRFDFVNQVDAFLRVHSYFFRWFNQRFFFLAHRLKKALSGEMKKEGAKPVPLPRTADRPHVEEALQILDSIWKIAQSKQAKMLVLFIGRPFDWPEEAAYYEEILSKKGIDCLNLMKFEDTPRWRFAPAGHWNAFGSREAAEKVYEFIRKRHLLSGL